MDDEMNSWANFRSEWKNCEMTGLLIAVNILFFIIEAVTGGSENTENVMRLGALYEPFVAGGQYWRLLTSMFLHFGFLHLMNNMVALFAFGRYMERMLGKIRFLIVYIGGGIVGGMIVCLWDYLTQTPAVTAGASGAICALIGSMLAVSILYRRYLRGISPQRVLLAAFIAIAPGFYAENISFTGHIGGFVGGFLITFLMLALLKKRTAKN